MIDAFIYFSFIKSFATFNKHGFCDFFWMLELICHILFFLLDKRGANARNSSSTSC